MPKSMVLRSIKARDRFQRLFYPEPLGKGGVVLKNRHSKTAKFVIAKLSITGLSAVKLVNKTAIIQLSHIMSVPQNQWVKTFDFRVAPDR
jgi:hypothetical protein